MTVVGLHPEELFDKLLDGDITPSERQRLQQHLDACEVCRFEHAARLDFRAEALDLMATTTAPSLLLRPPLPVAGERVTPLPAKPARRRRPRALIWGLAAALLITASGAVASGISGRAPWRAFSVFQTRTQTVAPVAAVVPKKVQRSRPEASVVLAPVTPAPELVPAPAPALAPPVDSAATHPEHHPSKAAAARVAVDPVPATEAALPAHAEMPTEPAPAPAPVTASQLFGDANQARRVGDIGRASGLYHLLQEQFPSSPEADLSRVTLALLQLDSGDAQAALNGFERYLAGSSRGLEAEALVGRARALGRLGRRDLEAAAWREVQRKYPRSIYGRQANERLAALGLP